MGVGDVLEGGSGGHGLVAFLVADGGGLGAQVGCGLGGGTVSHWHGGVDHWGWGVRGWSGGGDWSWSWGGRAGGWGGGGGSSWSWGGLRSGGGGWGWVFSGV